MPFGKHFIKLSPEELVIDISKPMEGHCFRKCFHFRLKTLLFFLIFSLLFTYILYSSSAHQRSGEHRKLIVPKLPKEVLALNNDDQNIEYNRFPNGSHVIDMSKDIQIFGDDDVTRNPVLKQRLPGCIIIGVKKAGTGAIVQFLKMHPDVAIGDYELNFFDYPETYAKGLEFYRKMMPYSREGQITMEKTSNYFHHKDTEWRIKNMNSSIKLILLVREPISRTVSDYLQRTLKDKEIQAPPVEEFVIDQDTGEIDEQYVGLKPSLYYKHMKRWLSVFPMSQIHIIDADELVSHPYEEVRKVEVFLGLPNKITKDRFVYSRHKGFYCMMLDTKDGHRKEKCLSKGKGRTHPEVDPDVMDKLKKYFQPKNEKFFELIGKRFNWEY